MKKERLKILLENAIVFIEGTVGERDADYLKDILGITKEELGELGFHYDYDEENEEECTISPVKGWLIDVETQKCESIELNNGCNGLCDMLKGDWFDNLHIKIDNEVFLINFEVEKDEESPLSATDETNFLYGNIFICKPNFQSLSEEDLKIIESRIEMYEDCADEKPVLRPVLKFDEWGCEE